jgi:hypothetical protein
MPEGATPEPFAFPWNVLPERFSKLLIVGTRPLIPCFVTLINRDCGSITETKLPTKRLHAIQDQGRRPRGFWERLRTPRHILVHQARMDAVQEAPRRRSPDLGHGAGHRLTASRYPIRNKGDLVRALGGKGATVDTKGGPKMLAEEAADLCFTEGRVFRDPEEVLSALKRTSWPRATTKAMHLAPFPLMGPTLLRTRVGNVRIDGVDISSLSIGLPYPISNTTQLLESLAEARSKVKSPPHP